MPTSLRIRRHVSRLRATDRSSAVSPDVVGAGLADALRAAAPADRGGVWLIRRLDVHAAVAAGAGPREIAGSLAAALVRELDQTMEAGAKDADVRWYPDRAAFLVQWLVDLPVGRVLRRWEYAGFAAESPSAAIRVRAEAEPDQLLQALRRLAPADLDELVALLSPPDAAAVASSLACGPGSARAGELASTAAQLTATGRLPRDPRRATLLVLVSHVGSPGIPDAALARDITDVLLGLQACPWADRDALLAALQSGDWATATRLGATTAVTALARWLAGTRAEALHEIGQASATSRASTSGRGYTRFGGQFLLLPLLAELPLAEATSGWPALEGTRPDAVLGALAVVGVLGTDLVLADPYFRVATGLPDCTRGDLARWTDDVGAPRLSTLRRTLDDVLHRRADGVRADLDDPDLLVAGLPQRTAATIRTTSSALLRELAYRLPGMATASVAHVRRNVLTLDAHVTLDDERIVVELGHPPLNLLLSLTGMNRRSFTLPSTGDRPWIVTTQR
jgi:hypothetical protein